MLPLGVIDVITCKCFSIENHRVVECGGHHVLVCHICSPQNIDIIQAARQTHERLMDVHVISRNRLYDYAPLMVTVLVLTLPGNRASVPDPMTAVDASNHAREPPLCIGSHFLLHLLLVPPPHILPPESAYDKSAEGVQTLTPQLLPYSAKIFHSKGANSVR